MSSILCPTPYAPRLLAFALVALLSLLALAPTAPAQCFGPDGLNGPCCTPVTPTLPPFPAITMQGLGVCWQGCVVGTQNKLTVVWATPVQPFCGQYQTPLTVVDNASGTTILTGTLILDYTRTWDEVDTTGVGRQVWRFTAKADLSSPGTSTALICPKPNCISPIGPHPTAFYYGYVDYAGCTAGGPWETALVLFHNCDNFMHRPGLSDKPGVFHPANTFAIVAPNSAAQPFVPSNMIAPLNPVMGEAVRRTDAFSPPPSVCWAEDRVQQAAFTFNGAGCLNIMAGNPKQQSLRQFNGTTFCPTGGQWASLNVNFPVFPWFHMVSTSIGMWTSPLAYPGQEHAWVDEGFFAHREPCTAFVIDMKYGATTYGGWAAFTSVGPVKGFTDLADNYTAPVGGPYPSPVLGSVRRTERLLYVNQ